jgi:hypothetical protein
MKATKAISILGALAMASCGLANMKEGDTGPLDATGDTGADPPGGDAVIPDVPGPEEGYDGPAPWEDPCYACEPGVGCEDGIFCNGLDHCLYSEYASRHCCYHEGNPCAAETEVDVCHESLCIEEVGECVVRLKDEDGDGHGASRVNTAAPDETPVWVECPGPDCDDADYSVHPGARELCDDLDNDCDGATDENAWVPDGTPLLLSDPANQPFSVSIASNAGAWGVAWLVETSLGRVIVAGTITSGATGPVASIGAYTPTWDVPLDVTIVSQGAGFVIAFITTEGEYHRIKGVGMGNDGTVAGTEYTILNLNGQILDMIAVEETVSGNLGFFFRSDVHWDYEVYHLGVPWPTTYPAHVDNLHRITYSAGFSGRPSAAHHVDSTSGAARWAVAWEDDRDGNSEIYFTTMSEPPSGRPVGRRITSAPGDSQNASVAASPFGGFALAWMDSRAGGYDMLLTCLDASGARTCPELAIESGPEKAWYPHVAYDDHDQYVVAYAGLESGQFHTALTAVAPSATPPPVEVDPGRELDGENEVITDPTVADTDSHRGVLWVENDGGVYTAVYFQQLKCEEGT